MSVHRRLGRVFNIKSHAGTDNGRRTSAGNYGVGWRRSQAWNWPRTNRSAASASSLAKVYIDDPLPHHLGLGLGGTSTATGGLQLGGLSTGTGLGLGQTGGLGTGLTLGGLGTSQGEWVERN